MFEGARLSLLVFVVLVCFSSFVIGDGTPGDHKNQTSSSGCAAKLTCGDCIDDKECVWCDTSNECKDGGFYGVSGELFGGCNDWRWGQCQVNGKILLAAVAGGGLGIGLLGLLVLCFCCCCCKKKKKKHSGYARVSQEDELETFVSRDTFNPETQERKKRFHQKWGTPEERAARRERFNAILSSTRATTDNL